MRKIFLLVLSFVSFKVAFSQTDQSRIDSVFKFYFFIFDLETKCDSAHLKFSQYYDTIFIKETQDTAYLNKFVTEAAVFIQEISGIKSPISHHSGPESNTFTVNLEMVEKWKSWYSQNRNKLKWSRKKSKPILKN